ncbi:MAG TPA: CDP-diacylglycerol diphosphatase [Stellaceae bacterium]|nr:CDP-diacylglycerol diphosphatase [Stellaceae bacterium]
MLVNAFKITFAARSATLLVLAAALIALSTMRGIAADPDALWKIVHDRCVPNAEKSGQPTPCALVDLQGGGDTGYAVLKDLVGVAQFLLIPTSRLGGIESPELLAASAPNYWEDAWQARRYVESKVGRALDRDAVGLAINSASGRSQAQLHIHVDCLRPDVRAFLRAHEDEIGSSWSPPRFHLSGHPYRAMRIAGGELGGADPFKLLAGGVPGARASMASRTLVMTGASFADGKDGFYLLTDQVDLLAGDFASGEELLDHDCAVAKSLP